MKLYIKQKVFSWTDHFTVKNEAGEDKYTVEGELFSWGKKLHVLDGNGYEAAYIEQKLWSFLPKYRVYQNENLAAEIIKEFTFLKPRYSIEGPDWQVEGDLWGHEYEVTQQGRAIVRISKEWFTWGDSYLIDIQDTADEVMALSCVLAIDCIMADSNNG